MRVGLLRTGAKERGVGHCIYAVNFFFMERKGLSDRDKRLQVRHLLNLWGADVICLQETKLELITRSLVRSLWGSHHVD